MWEPNVVFVEAADFSVEMSMLEQRQIAAGMQNCQTKDELPHCFEFPPQYQQCRLTLQNDKNQQDQQDTPSPPNLSDSNQKLDEKTLFTMATEVLTHSTGGEPRTDSDLNKNYFGMLVTD